MQLNISEEENQKSFIPPRQDIMYLEAPFKIDTPPYNSSYSFHHNLLVENEGAFVNNDYDVSDFIPKVELEKTHNL